MSKVRFRRRFWWPASIAESRYIAEDRGRVDRRVDFDTLTPHLDMFSHRPPLRSRSTPTSRTTCTHHETKVYRDVAGAIADADRVVEAQFRSPRLTHVPNEPRGVVAQWAPGTEGAHPLHRPADDACGANPGLLPDWGSEKPRIRNVSPDVGEHSAERSRCTGRTSPSQQWAMHLNRPVKWIEDRSENLTASTHARDDAVYIQAAVRNDGTNHRDQGGGSGRTSGLTPTSPPVHHRRRGLAVTGWLPHRKLRVHDQTSH